VSAQVFKPSDVKIDPTFPFVGTFGKSEYEVTVATIVKALELTGDEWRTISGSEVANCVESLDSRSDAWRRMFKNPFQLIDPQGTAAAGWITCGAEGFALTPAALDRIAKWVQP